MKNSTKIFGIILFASGIIMMFADMYFLNNPDYRSMIKWWYIALLCGGGVGLYILTDDEIKGFIKGWLNKNIK